jgi:hypothetical protein
MKSSCLDPIAGKSSSQGLLRASKLSSETLPGPQAIIPSAMKQPAFRNGELNDQRHQQQTERGKSRGEADNEEQR